MYLTNVDSHRVEEDVSYVVLYSVAVLCRKCNTSSQSGPGWLNELGSWIT